MSEIDTSAEAVEQHLNLSDNHEAGLIPVGTVRLLRALAAERDALATRLAEMEARDPIEIARGTIATLTDRLAEVERERDKARTALSAAMANYRDAWEAMRAMRNSINEHVPMPSEEADANPEAGTFCAAVTEAVIAALATARAETAAVIERAKAVIDACDRAKMRLKPGRGIGGQTVEAGIRAIEYCGVDAWPVEELREAVMLTLADATAALDQIRRGCAGMPRAGRRDEMSAPPQALPGRA